MLTPGLNSRSDRNRVEKQRVRATTTSWHRQLLRSDHNDIRSNVVSHNFESAIGADNGSAGNRVRENLITENADSITCRRGLRDRDQPQRRQAQRLLRSPPTPAASESSSDGSDDSTVDRNVVVGGRGPAIFVTSLDTTEISDRNVISRNVANSTLSDAILVNADATDTLIQRNSADGNGEDGIKVDTTGTTLSRNSANRNHDLGIEAVPGVIDGGGNHAFGNGNPAQCVNIACGWMR